MCRLRLYFGNSEGTNEKGRQNSETGTSAVDPARRRREKA
jgi:hypothetical protein